ncbi:hypothetical protein BX616_006194 [Lobosporangium transversale]|uniref:Uncharacterized protein n=1 Tax=Lobosporangium transversale TaxID=64571 RepID=A0A1Y2GN36_9FUNG|nr:hypothetical protein BCR41DRAFT_396191 [Lobosporangium transversale]KAF9897092.1 hypothetical protein BX616_006194 [Lobosporangium transversale]ORZ16046.1 hypothetical protein BCR41DRAFT_396191 [Lobosporangium transversale]|eukprot:XP_021881393.1 hypothetical protein BCR41DRAFT_396191 [Lobosporangium transversale]
MKESEPTALEHHSYLIEHQVLDFLDKDAPYHEVKQPALHPVITKHIVSDQSRQKAVASLQQTPSSLPLRYLSSPQTPPNNHSLFNTLQQGINYDRARNETETEVKPFSMEHEPSPPSHPPVVEQWRGDIIDKTEPSPSIPSIDKIPLFQLNQQNIGKGITFSSSNDPRPVTVKAIVQNESLTDVRKELIGQRSMHQSQNRSQNQSEASGSNSIVATNDASKNNTEYSLDPHPRTTLIPLPTTAATRGSRAENSMLPSIDLQVANGVVVSSGICNDFKYPNRPSLTSIDYKRPSLPVRLKNLSSSGSTSLGRSPYHLYSYNNSSHYLLGTSRTKSQKNKSTLASIPCSPGHQVHPQVDPGPILGVRRPIRTKQYLLYDVPFYGIENVDISSSRHDLLMRQHSLDGHNSGDASHAIASISTADANNSPSIGTDTNVGAGAASPSLAEHREHIWFIAHEHEYGTEARADGGDISNAAVGSQALLKGRHKRFQRSVPIQEVYTSKSSNSSSAPQPKDVSFASQGGMLSPQETGSSTISKITTTSTRPSGASSEGPTAEGTGDGAEDLLDQPRRQQLQDGSLNQIPHVSQGVYGPDTFAEYLLESSKPPNSPQRHRRRYSRAMNQHWKNCLCFLVFVAVIVVVPLMVIRKGPSSSSSSSDPSQHN